MYNVNSKPDGFRKGREESMPFDLDKIGQLLKAARIEKGLTLEDVSARAFHQEVYNRSHRIGGLGKSASCRLREGLRHPVRLFSEYTRPRQAGADAEGTPGGAAKGAPGAPAPREGMPLSRRDSRKKIVGVAVMAGILVAFLVFLNVQRPGRAARPPYQTPQHNQQAAASGDQRTRRTA